MKKLIILTTLIFTTQITKSNELDSLFLEANHQYEETKYDEALQLYLDIKKTNEYSPTIYHNIGNCYYKKGDMPNAILYYKKALKINTNIDTERNLDLARKRIQFIEPLPILFFINWWNKFTEILKLKHWAIALMLNVWVIGFFICLFFNKKEKNTLKLLLYSTILLIILLLTTKNSYNKHHSKSGVVIKKTNLYNQENNTGQKTFIEEGNTIKILQQKNKNILVETPNGEQGWIEANCISEI